MLTDLAMEQSFDSDEIRHFADAEFDFSGECEVFILRFVGIFSFSLMVAFSFFLIRGGRGGGSRS